MKKQNKKINNSHNLLEKRQNKRSFFEQGNEIHTAKRKVKEVLPGNKELKRYGAEAKFPSFFQDQYFV